MTRTKRQIEVMTNTRVDSAHVVDAGPDMVIHARSWREKYLRRHHDLASEVIDQDMVHADGGIPSAQAKTPLR